MSNYEVRLAARREVDNRGDEVEVVLRGAGRTYASIAALAVERSTAASLRIFDADGRPVANSGGGLEWHPGQPGLFQVRALVPGVYRLEVTAEDGRTWSAKAEAYPFEDTEVVLR